MCPYTRKPIYLVLFFFFLSVHVYAQKNRALLIAIDNYPPGNGWSKIHGTNDLRIILPVLMASGYKEEDIIILENEQATRNTIVCQFEKLTERCEKGDYVYVHFSCHGQQMADDNGDEPDGLDEAMIPYDAKRRYTEREYEGENHLRDDLIGDLLNAIRYKIGPNGNVTVLFDACHSGTADRNEEDEAYIRGTTYIFAPKNFKIPSMPPKEAVFQPFYQEDMAHITIISACRPEERNYEYRLEESGEYYGSLTYAFVQTLCNSEKEVSNKIFFDNLCVKMGEMSAKRRRMQTPFIETTNNNGLFKLARNE